MQLQSPLKKETEKKMKSELNPDGTKKYTKEDIEKKITLINNAEQDIIDGVAVEVTGE